jgi:hypothetical protein
VSNSDKDYVAHQFLIVLRAHLAAQSDWRHVPLAELLDRAYLEILDGKKDRTPQENAELRRLKRRFER